MDSRADSLAAADPNLAAQWHPKRNGSMTPADVKETARREVFWWKCPVCGHEWKALLAEAPLAPGAKKMLAVCRAKSPSDVRGQLSALTAHGWVLLGMRGVRDQGGNDG